MREVRSSSAKGWTRLPSWQTYYAIHISGLLLPLRSIMQRDPIGQDHPTCGGSLAADRSGLNANKHLAPAELLVLCHTLISQNARFLKDAPSSKKRKGNLKGDGYCSN